MSAQIYILPIVPRFSPHDPAWREQHERELIARQVDDVCTPPRTRPLLVSRQLIDGHRPTEHHKGEG